MWFKHFSLQHFHVIFFICIHWFIKMWWTLLAFCDSFGWDLLIYIIFDSSFHNLKAWKQLICYDSLPCLLDLSGKLVPFRFTILSKHKIDSGIHSHHNQSGFSYTNVLSYLLKMCVKYIFRSISGQHSLKHSLKYGQIPQGYKIRIIVFFIFCFFLVLDIISNMRDLHCYLHSSRKIFLLFLFMWYQVKNGRERTYLDRRQIPYRGFFI